MFGRSKVTPDQMKEAVASAVKEVTTAVTLATHIEQCKKDKDEIKEAIKQKDAGQMEMHRENKAELAALRTEFSKMQKYVFLAMGGLTALAFLASHLARWIEMLK